MTETLCNEYTNGELHKISEKSQVVPNDLDKWWPMCTISYNTLPDGVYFIYLETWVIWMLIITRIADIKDILHKKAACLINRGLKQYTINDH